MYNSYIRYSLLETNKLVCLFRDYFILNEWGCVNTQSNNYMSCKSNFDIDRVNTEGPWLGLYSIYDIKIKQRWVGQ